MNTETPSYVLLYNNSRIQTLSKIQWFQEKAENF